MPLFVWALYATALIQILATPVLGITLLLLIRSSAFKHIGIFDAALGGDPVLFQHFFWFYSPPRRLHHDPAGFRRDLRPHQHGPQP
jgi:cytochrome c oxidase subunit 1